MELQVYKQDGTKASMLTVNKDVFGIEPHMTILHDVVVAQRNAMRQGTHKTKTRSEVRGGGRKPWRQKGTGRARHGSRRSPIWRGGGVTFGPTPRSYGSKLNRKAKRLALKSALSYHVLNNNVVVLETLQQNDIKTKNFVTMMNALNLTEKTLFVDKELQDVIILSGRNIPKVKLENADHTSVYQLMDANQLVLTVEAIKYFEEVLGRD
ncbi:MAG: 50S ribosomal protein L4 [Acholeplasmatales bacterium]|jgi:large subunit ribosomal protein L4|nr:50S ribosomal protein L4 [Acholeplasmataceae bacterium]MDY0115814.1 50S ribosomal protein L4 [Acholeplasmatales bacterium]MCK9234388.1 50S ribosomal protein L4 [Acholeplasmataceae bacterium]MCK9289816.1 50S ribosomal protein L4 [Acholeplasmataceae bacterium]MCK9427217.1 50S ribosomal protein L4 [Acholeplasmataceae bacterium]